MFGLVMAAVAVAVAVAVAWDAGKKLVKDEVEHGHHGHHGPLAHEGVVWAGM